MEKGYFEMVGKYMSSFTGLKKCQKDIFALLLSCQNDNNCSAIKAYIPGRKTS